MESVLVSALVIITIIVCLIIEKEPHHLCPRCGHKNMKHIIQLLLASIIMFGITACHTENDDYYSTVSIILSANDDITIEQMQGTITLRNTSNGQQYSSSSINRNSTTVYVLKGAYTLSAEGTCSYKTADGKLHTSYFRASNDYLEIINNNTLITSNIKLMNQ